MQGAEYTSPLYLQGSQRTFYKRGDEYTSPLYSSGGNETVTLQGSAVSQTLYYKSSSGSYIAFGETLYRGGSQRTFYKRGSLIDTSLFYDGGSEKVWIRGDLCPSELHYAGTKRAELKLAEIETTHLYGLTHT